MAGFRPSERRRGTARRGLLPWIADLFRPRASDLVEADAKALIEAHGIGAYGIARSRARQVAQGRLVHDSRIPGHWRAVSHRVAELVGHEIGLDNATRRLRE
ncbi:hypothetical protein [Bosea sp. ASV33]|uniref:hypothetical protein n=1 Tax=Bosea sp. ASV33 TaxID=2795106 RepID=UPI0018ED3754|nr:hypothetical protein [Bosea sp. ASV33]